MKLKPEWIERDCERKKSKREKKCRRTRAPYFADSQILLLLTVIYAKTNCGNILLAVLFGISGQTVYDISRKTLPLLQNRFMPDTKFRKKKGTIHTMEELLREYLGLDEVIADGTDIVTRRPTRK